MARMLRFASEADMPDRLRTWIRKEARKTAPTPAHADADPAPIHLRAAIIAAGLPAPIREYTWHETRNWRLDLAWPDRKRAVEIDGMAHRIKGRHLDGIERHNAMTMAGWRWLRLTPVHARSADAVETVREFLAASEWPPAPPTSPQADRSAEQERTDAF